MTTSTGAPPWPACGFGPAPVSAGCRGRSVTPHSACLEHLGDRERAAYLAALAPGAALDHRGTAITRGRLAELLAAVVDQSTHMSCPGDASFEEATFTGHASFMGATFTGNAAFRGATFTGKASFEGATFTGDASFVGATFTGHAGFEAATFTGDASFEGATFTGYASFEAATFTGDASFVGATFTGHAYFGHVMFTGRADFEGVMFTDDTYFEGARFAGRADFGNATFTGDAHFGNATFTHNAHFQGITFTRNARFIDAKFTGDAHFGNATFTGDAHFGNATFTRNARFMDATFTGDARFRGSLFSQHALFRRAQIQQTGEWDLVCDGVLQFDEAVFQRPILVRAAARTVDFRRTHFVSTTHLRLQYATVDLTDAVLEAPTTVSPANTRFSTPPGTASTLLDPPPRAAPVYPAVKVASVSGVDAAHLVLADVDLTDCRFTGAVHLDQLRMDGHCTLAQPPTGMRRRRLLPVRHTRRSVVAEERHWQHARSADGGGWPPPAAPGPVVAAPAALAAVYRQLRKSLEDGKNEAEAADFYYGEMQMRRHNRARPGGERVLLALYWAVSGYGQRASRAFGWLFAAMAVTLVGMVLWGMPVDDPKPRSEGDVVAGHVTLVTDTPSPVNPTGPLGERVTGRRTEKAGRVVVNSVIFRSSGQNLTTTGTYLEMASRLAEPVLLGFGLLAVRSRVKR
ncbi:pentapeptide repeat-containing protein [Kitasatospora purpeofusca]|uniref:pentapeptide repeat-containing protein n=1 Tax=Kitasatospora purpeofusca TaxID=67352 RepID=UPI0037F81C6C